MQLNRFLVGDEGHTHASQCPKTPRTAKALREDRLREEFPLNEDRGPA